jgi:hypothetical protein
VSWIVCIPKRLLKRDLSVGMTSSPGFRKGTIDIETLSRVSRNNILGLNREDSAERRSMEKDRAASLDNSSIEISQTGITTSSKLARTENQNHTRVFQTVRADKEYNAKDSAELTISVGEVITLRGVPEFGWCEGEVNGKVGWFPVSVTDSIEVVLESATRTDNINNVSLIIHNYNFVKGKTTLYQKQSEVKKTFTHIYVCQIRKIFICFRSLDREICCRNYFNCRKQKKN